MVTSSTKTMNSLNTASVQYDGLEFIKQVCFRPPWLLYGHNPHWFRADMLQVTYMKNGGEFVSFIYKKVNKQKDTTKKLVNSQKPAPSKNVAAALALPLAAHSQPAARPC